MTPAQKSPFGYTTPGTSTGPLASQTPRPWTHNQGAGLDNPDFPPATARHTQHRAANELTSKHTALSEAGTHLEDT